MNALPSFERKYVNREEEINLLKRTINYIRLSGPVFQTIYEWTGIPGIGKTVLIELLYDLCTRMGVPYAHLDFDPECNPHAQQYDTEPILIIKELFVQLGKEKSVELEEAFTQYRQLPAEATHQREQALDEAVLAFRRYIYQLLEKDPVVFLFDTTDKALPAVLSWLEEKLIAFLSQNGRCLFVFAGRTPLHWRRFEVRRRVRTGKLTAFEVRFVREQFEQERKHPKLIRLSERVHHLTDGHPMSSALILNRLSQMADEGKEVDEETYATYEPELLDDLVREVIDGYIFKDVKPALANACRAIALLRQFDVILLRRVLSEYVPDFKDYPKDAYGSLLGLLHVTHLVEWNDVRKGYEIDPVLRRILGRYMREKNPSLYIKINQTAREVYQDWIGKVEDNRSVYIIEELYHQASLEQVKPPQGRWQEKLIERLQEHLRNHYTGRDPELLLSALERLDKGLERDNELQELIGEETMAALLETIAAHKAELKQKLPR